MKAGRKMLSDRQSNNTRFSLTAAREYSDLYKRADVARKELRAKKDADKGIIRHEEKVGNTTFHWTEKVKSHDEIRLDNLFKRKKDIKAQISALKSKEKFEDLSLEEEKTLDGLFKELKAINNNPLMVAKHKEIDTRNAKKAFEYEVVDLWMNDVRFWPKEMMKFVAGRKEFIKNSKFEYNGRVFAFVRCEDNANQYHWVKL